MFNAVLLINRTKWRSNEIIWLIPGENVRKSFILVIPFLVFLDLKLTALFTFLCSFNRH